MEFDTWELTFSQELLPRILSCSHSPFLLGVVAPPGMGKALTHLLSPSHASDSSQDIVQILPMDGFHYYKHELDAMSNPELMHFRRGAHFTFNPAKLSSKLSLLKAGQTVSFPTFSHRVADPEEDRIWVNPEITKVVIIEGLYLYLEEDIWRDIRSLIDFKLYIHGNLDAAMERVYARNLACIGLSPEATRRRIQENDRVNGELVETTRVYADKVVEFKAKDSSMLTRFE